MDYRSCIDACNECASACLKCAATDLVETDNTHFNRCIQLNLECATMCTAASQLMSLSSEKSKEVCLLCAQMCDTCAEECEKHEEEHCRQCAWTCRKCAEVCRLM